MSIDMPEKVVEPVDAAVVPQNPSADWRKIHALGLPEGSIRAALAIGIFGTIWALTVCRPEHEIPDYLRDLLFIIMGHYFAARRKVSVVTPSGPGAMYLPRGTVRIVLFAGFALVGFVLFRQGRLGNPASNPAVVTLMLVSGFLLGVLVARIGDMWSDRGHHVPRWVEDAKALLAMVAAVGLILMVWGRFEPHLLPQPAEALRNVEIHLGSYGPEHVLGAIVGFYFGSRS